MRRLYESYERASSFTVCRTVEGFICDFDVFIFVKWGTTERSSSSVDLSNLTLSTPGESGGFDSRELVSM